ncbi:MAG: cytochrome c oxidase subunit 3 [Elusimicrobia bacterium]|nr:cytochrome c oxidase subunit 3 [Elusimicrobiota bacterium]
MNHAATMQADYEETGITNAKLGLWLFLASEIMLFATLFTTYIVLRLGAGSWPRGWEVLNVPLATANTFVLISSSVTMVLAYAKSVEKDLPGFKLWMGLTILLGLVFLVIKGFEYGAKFNHGLFPSTSIFYAVYFTMTGLHGLHVIIGILVNAYFWLASSSQFDHPLFTGRIEGSGLYWHFVDLVWIFLFPGLYLL